MHCGEGQGCVCFRGGGGVKAECVLGRGLMARVYGVRRSELSVTWKNQIQSWGVGVSLCAGGGGDLGHRVFKGERSVDCTVCLGRSGSLLIARLGWGEGSGEPTCPFCCSLQEFCAGCAVGSGA